MAAIALAETPDDLAYVRGNYVPFPARGLPGETDWPGTYLPRATYRTPDGASWFTRDLWRLHDDAGGIAGVRALFERRVIAAARMIDHPIDPATEWDAYVAGLYGACLRDVTPEMIVMKEALVARLDRLLAEPRPDDASWRARLLGDVDMLDGILRPFAACDRVRFGRATSRDRLVTDVRRRFE
ncbi:MAG TPA: DUF6058 family natural product biosynthesis protein [Kofleriaceae bacterium]|jgi:hypothetical protein